MPRTQLACNQSLVREMKKGGGRRERKKKGAVWEEKLI